MTVASWTNKAPKMTQPDLNFIAPEIQLGRNCCSLSDMFALGLVVCSIYNCGRSLIAADHNPSLYVKQLDQVITANMKTVYLTHRVDGNGRRNNSLFFSMYFYAVQRKFFFYKKEQYLSLYIYIYTLYQRKATGSWKILVVL